MRGREAHGKTAAELQHAIWLTRPLNRTVTSLIIGELWREVGGGRWCSCTSCIRCRWTRRPGRRPAGRLPVGATWSLGPSRLARLLTAPAPLAVEWFISAGGRQRLVSTTANVCGFKYQHIRDLDPRAVCGRLCPCDVRYRSCECQSTSSDNLLQTGWLGSGHARFSSHGLFIRGRVKHVMNSGSITKAVTQSTSNTTIRITDTV